MIGGAVHWANTITTGTVIIGIVIVALFALSTVTDRGTKRWRELYELADAERKELSKELRDTGDRLTSQLEDCNQTITAQKEVIAKLEVLQMPLQVMESLQANQDAAADRQHEILERIEEDRKTSTERLHNLMQVLDLIAQRLGPDPNGDNHESGTHT